MPRMVKRWLPVYGLYLICAMVITWPLVARMGTHLAGYYFTDSQERIHHIWWLTHALRTGQPLFWLPNLGWPDGMAGISLLGQPLQQMPAALLALVFPLVVADNLSLLLHTALMGMGMYALGLQLARGSRTAALVGGLVFMAAPTFQAHLGDGHNMHHSLAFAPLFVLALIRMRNATGRSRRNWFVAGSLCFALVTYGYALNAIYILLPLAILFAMQRAIKRDWPGFAQLLLMCLTGAMLQVLFLLPVIGETLGNRVYTAAGGDVKFSLDLLSIVTPSHFHPLYGQLEHTLPVLTSRPAERSSWIGLVPGALSLLALARGRGRFWLGLALLSWVLALGPFLKLLGEPLVVHVDGRASYLTLPLVFLEGLPILNLNRTPGRFGFALALAIACLATYGTALLAASSGLQRGWRRILATAILLILILFDYQWYWPLPTFEAQVPAGIASLAKRSGLRAVLDVPVLGTQPEKEALWLQTAHQKPLLGGYIIRGSPANPARLQLLQDTLDPALLQIAGADIVIVHKRHASRALIERAAQNLGPPIYADKYFAVHETPGTDAAPVQFIPPPATLQVTWPRTIPLYNSGPGWLDLSGVMTASRRDLVILLDNVPVQRWKASRGNAQSRSVSLPLWPDSWQRVTLAPAPACPVVPSAAVECSRIVLEQLEVEVIPANHVQARFAEGVELLAATAPSQAIAGENLDLRMHWLMLQGRDSRDVRFVHLLDGDGQIVAQSDEASGSIAAGAQVSDLVTLSLPEDLSPGEYSVWLGWYDYPEIRRLPLIEPAGYEGDLLPLGVVRIE